MSLRFLTPFQPLRRNRTTGQRSRREGRPQVAVGDSLPDSAPGINALSGHYQPDEIAPLAVYLASDDARMMTGQAVNLDVGICMA